MICPLCHSDIRIQTVCPVCGTEIELEGDEDRHYPWILVWTTNTLLDAEMFKANLESADIPVHILSQVDSMRQFTVGELAIVKIYVPSIYETDARAIIEAIESGNGGK